MPQEMKEHIKQCSVELLHTQMYKLHCNLLIIIIIIIIIILLDLLARFHPRTINKLSEGDSDANTYNT